jgi:glycosyltransferase involved in cell wall biosynthesis
MLTFSIRAYNRIRALQPTLKFDVIHDNQCLAYGLLLMKRLNIPVVATIHHPIHIDRQIELAQAKSLREKWRLWRWFSFIGMQRRVSPRLDRIITVSRTSAGDIQRYFKVPEKLLRVVLNGIDIDFFHGDGQMPREPNSLIMVSSGNGHTKGLPYLLQALHKLRNETGIRLTVVGNGNPEAEPATLVREYGLEDTVSFTGKIKREELARLYATAEIAVVPSLHEGFGFPAAEAMSSRLPIVSTMAGALPEVVGKNGSAGILVPPRDADALATALKRLLADKQLGRNMGEAGRKRVVENFSWRQAARQTVQVYEELL